jgi:hypothetical protein
MNKTEKSKIQAKKVSRKSKILRGVALAAPLLFSSTETGSLGPAWAYPFVKTPNVLYRGGNLPVLPRGPMLPEASKALADVNAAFAVAEKRQQRGQGVIYGLPKNAGLKRLPLSRLPLRVRQRVHANTNTKRPDFLKNIAANLGGQHGIVPQAAFDAFLAHKLPKLDEYSVFAHGMIYPPDMDESFFTVPKDTAIVYVTMPGLYSLPGTKYPRNRKQLMKNARQGRATSDGGYLVMYTEGSRVPNTVLDFNDGNGAFRHLTGVFDAKTGVRTNQTGESVQHLIKKSGPGVY